MTPAQLKQILPQLTLAKAEAILPAIVEACRRWDITTKLRVAAFLAQCGHESGGFQFLTEFASGDAYEGRADLGNTQPGDGRRYKGRGAIQLTGRNNYKRAGQELGQDFENNPERVAQMPWAMQVSGWYWRRGSSRGDLNKFADTGTTPVTLSATDQNRWNRQRGQEGSDTSAFDKPAVSFDYCTLGVNGGFRGKKERDAIYARALAFLPENPLDSDVVLVPMAQSAARGAGAQSTARGSGEKKTQEAEAEELALPVIALVGSAAFLVYKVLKRRSARQAT